MKRVIHIVLALLCHSAQALILESNQISGLLPHIYNSHNPQDVLIVFDIDNTLGHVADGFGGDEWFTAMIQERIAAGDTIHMALDYVLPIYYVIQQAIWLDLIEPETARMIHFLQNAHIKIMALTSRSLTLKDRTYEQLAHMGINLALTAPCTDALGFAMHDEAYFEHGILFSASHSKGELLVHFFQTIGWQPKKVIFIDDKLKYAKQVDEALKQIGIDCVAIRYGRLDQKVDSFKLVDHQERLAAYNMVI